MVASIAEIARTAVPVLKHHGVVRAALFCSSARGDLRDDSDVDLLIELGPTAGLLDFVRLKLDLEDALRRGVDLVEYDSIKPIFRNRILNEQVSIL